MTAERGAGGTREPDVDDGWQYVPPSMRPIRARAAAAASVMLFAAGLVTTLALPSYASEPPRAPDDGVHAPRTAQHYQAPDLDGP